MLTVSSRSTRRQIEFLVEALDDEPVSHKEATEAIQRMGIDVRAWAKDIRKRVRRTLKNQPSTP